MNYKFAKRILASTQEIDAVTYKQFLEWDEKEKRQYLQDHPNSKFGRQHEQGLTETKPYSQIRRERNQALHEKRTEQKPVGTSVTQRKRIRDPLEGPSTELTLSDGTTARIQKQSAGSTGGLGGWHDLDAPGHYSYLADTEDEAIKELLRRRAEQSQKKALTPLREDNAPRLQRPLKEVHDPKLGPASPSKVIEDKASLEGSHIGKNNPEAKEAVSRFVDEYSWLWPDTSEDDRIESIANSTMVLEQLAVKLTRVIDSNTRMSSAEKEAQVKAVDQIIGQGAAKVDPRIRKTFLKSILGAQSAQVKQTGK